MRFMSYQDLRNRGIRYSKMHLNRLIRAGKFPRAVKLSGCSNGENAWLEDEIDRYCADRIAERDRHDTPAA